MVEVDGAVVSELILDPTGCAPVSILSGHDRPHARRRPMSDESALAEEARALAEPTATASRSASPRAYRATSRS